MAGTLSIKPNLSRYCTRHKFITTFPQACHWAPNRLGVYDARMKIQTRDVPSVPIVPLMHHNAHLSVDARPARAGALQGYQKVVLPPSKAPRPPKNTNTSSGPTTQAYYCTISGCRLSKAIAPSPSDCDCVSSKQLLAFFRRGRLFTISSLPHHPSSLTFLRSTIILRLLSNTFLVHPRPAIARTLYQHHKIKCSFRHIAPAACHSSCHHGLDPMPAFFLCCAPLPLSPLYFYYPDHVTSQFLSRVFAKFEFVN